MTRPDLTLRALTALLLGGLLLQSCTGMNTAGSSIKTGMHIDAVLACAIEHPLSWTKDRRLVYGSKNGEILWQPPDADGTLLRLISEQRKTIEPEQQLTRQLQEFAELEITLREEVTLPVGEAIHITGTSPEKQIEIYQFSDTNRSYLVSLVMLKNNVKRYSGVMDKVIQTLYVLE